MKSSIYLFKNLSCNSNKYLKSFYNLNSKNFARSYNKADLDKYWKHKVEKFNENWNIVKDENSEK